MVRGHPVDPGPLIMGNDVSENPKLGPPCPNQVGPKFAAVSELRILPQPLLQVGALSEKCTWPPQNLRFFWPCGTFLKFQLMARFMRGLSNLEDTCLLSSWLLSRTVNVLISSL